MEESRKAELKKAQEDDIEYFTNKLHTAVAEKDWDNVIRAARQLKLFEDAVIVYRLHREEA